MSKRVFLLGCCVLAAFSVALADPLHPRHGAKITRNEAQHIALERFPHGRVVSATFESAPKRVWRIEVTQNESRCEIRVDAINGRIVSVRKMQPTR